MSDQSASTSENTTGFSARLFNGDKSLSEQDIYVSLTYDELNAKSIMDRVKSPKAGAVVLFAGMDFCTTRCYTLTDITQ
jgi:hypothetical protein